MDVKYAPADIDEMVSRRNHSMDNEINDLKRLLFPICFQLDLLQIRKMRKKIVQRRGSSNTKFQKFLTIRSWEN
jgi:hypothetical protein